MPPNPDIHKERLAASFKPDDVTSQIFGKEGMFARRLAYKRAVEDPELEVAERFSTLPRDQVYDQAIRLYSVYRSRIKQYGYYDGLNKITAAQNSYNDAVFIGSVYPFLVHHGMFIPMIESQGTDEQIKEFKPRAECLEIIGTYAQTEMGHGTYLKGLETTATFDRERQHFVINSPTLSSTKFWPAALGCTSNYAVVMAQLLIDGQPHGLHAFICQLRDLEDHKPLPGVELGDINEKFGFKIMDNGWLRFREYRITRTNMLMRYSQVSPEGVFTSQGVPQVTYLTMMMSRMMIVLGAADDLAKAATIATRYSAVRRQTANSHGAEPQILDYQTQQMKLFPAISTAFALFFTGIAVESSFNKLSAAVHSGDSSQLKEMHCLTSGMKAFASETAAALIETCRRSCGGHGYSHASGIPKLYTQCVAQCTYEGENTVMYLQCARTLVTFYMAMQAGQPVPGTMKLLTDSPEVPSQLHMAERLTVQLYITALKLLVNRKLKNVVTELQKSSKSMDYETAWNENSTELVETAKAYCLYFTVGKFTEALDRNTWETKARDAMRDLCEFYIANSIVTGCGAFLQNRILTRQQIASLTGRRIELLAALRPNAVALVDAFDYPDRMLNSCLGRHDGHVYEALYEYAKNSSLNKEQVHPSHHKYVKPMQRELKSKL